ncbi:receptor-type tyrosine-protein phosphatase T [Mytilus galloprovincialis]|uniref:protein-tyrosine-phosphatase n=1 Tax=Mytilus galloprovincialis TaxID=29158 RepID=A0A8B6FA26_MYTGA|nr:receptor-type tyrosine-protein phosphatase T [Mytilus galloprovincialis]
MLYALLIHVTVALTVAAQQNLALFGEATQSSNYGGAKAENVIKPPLSNIWSYKECTHTAESPFIASAWWMFNISYGIVFITDIMIYYRENFASRMDGFKLYITNSSTIPPTSYLCYEDPDPGLPNITQTISCNQLGQYVIYYDDKVDASDKTKNKGCIIELCYVSINGCRVNSTSKGMGYTIYASNSSRDPEKGFCLSRGQHLPKNISTNSAFRYLTYMPSIKSESVELEICEIGIVGCPSSNYGKLCEKDCPENCHGPCDLETGRCISGCSNGWIGEKCEEVGSDKKEDTNGATIGGIIGAIIVVILIILAVYDIYKRKSKSTNDKYSDKSKSSQRTTFNQKCESSNENEYVNAAITSETREVTVHLQDTEETDLPSGRNDSVLKTLPTDLSVYKINVQNLKKVIKGKRVEGGYKNEYEILPKGLVHPHVEGSKEENKVKNRFLTTWPYDHSRIVLKGNKKTDYINANYIDNYDKEKAYIAAQGPKKNTVRDFWHMIWQENVGKIVMVTQLKEGSREKCVQYWPDAVNDPMIRSEVKVVGKTLWSPCAKFRLKFWLKFLVKSQKERTIHHFHFTQWPDHGVPDSIQLVHFYRKVKLEDCDQYGPIVVHCSAGVGRTGTFIAIDALYEHGKKVNYVNVMEYVQMMRKDRMNMIQTPEQYETVFEALLELFTVQETNIQKNDFSKYMEIQERTTLPTHQKAFKQQFETLQTLRPLYPASEYTAANLRENISKNSVKNILPHDNFRPYLMSFGKKRTDYINAVIIPGYREESRFFVTQCPMKDTVVDFYTMIYDHNSRIIVLLDQVNPNAKLWLGRPETLVIDDFSIQQEEDHTMDKLKIALKYKKQQDKGLINVFTTSDWQGVALPSTKLMVDLLKSVVYCWKSLKCPITVVCRDGCTKSGLFVALYLLFDKIEIDEEVDVFQVVRKIQTRRPEFLKTSDYADDALCKEGDRSVEKFTIPLQFKSFVSKESFDDTNLVAESDFDILQTAIFDLGLHFEEMQAPSDRFTTVVTDEEISNLVNEKMNANTKKNTKWAVGVFNQWRSFRAQNRDPIIELHMMNAECMNYWLERFVMETRNQNGEEYPPKSLYYIVCGLLRHCRDMNVHDKNFLDQKDGRFAHFRRVLNAKIKDSLSKGLVMVCSVRQIQLLCNILYFFTTANYFDLRDETSTEIWTILSSNLDRMLLEDL